MIITTSMLKQQYRDYANPLDKIKRDSSRGLLFRLTRGLYENDRSVSPCFLAGAILSPSYLSFEWALSYYGLIPEKVFTVTSASLELGKTRVFTNVFGRFEYRDIPPSAFSEGLNYIQDGEYYAKIATKEKAICDCLSKWRVVRSVSELKVLLYQDMRFDEESFAQCDFALMRRLARNYRKTNLNMLIKLIEREYLHE